TLVSIVSGVFGEAALADDLRRWLEGVGFPRATSRIGASVATVVGITYLSLVLGELVPKRVAIANPEGMAKVVARPMMFLSRIGAPMVWLLTVSTNLVIRPFARNTPSTDRVTEDEVRGIIQQAALEGVLHAAEHELVERVLRLGDRRVKHLMVPRTQSEWLDAEATIDHVRVAVATSVHSHFPVCHGSLAKIVGVVHVKDVFRHLMVSRTVDLAEIAKPPLYVPEAIPAIRLAERFRQAGTKFAFVVDEYGGGEGIITLNDVLEALIGDAASPDSAPESLAVRRADGSWLIDGGMSIDQLTKLTGLKDLPNLDEGEYSTVAGMVTTVLGRIPRTGELFQWKDWRFEVVDLDGPRVDKVLAQQVRPRSGG
nr:hemolysin family protein [Phycisphaerales bacterium]